MKNFDASVFLNSITAQLSVPSLELEDAIVYALEKWGEAFAGIDSYPAFRDLVCSFIQTIYFELPAQSSPSDADVQSILTHMGFVDLINTYLDFKEDSSLGVRTLIELAQQVKNHLLEEKTRAILTELLAPLSFTERVKVAGLLAQEYSDTGLDIPLHYLAHELDQIIMKSIESSA